MKKVLLIALLCFAGLIVAFLVLAGLSTYLMHRATAPLSKPPEHGTAFVVEADFSQTPGETNIALLENALDKRIGNLGLRAFIEQISPSQLKIMMPPTANTMVDELRCCITHRGSLEFRLVNDDSAKVLANHEPIAPGYIVMQSLERTPDQQTLESLVVKKEAEEGVSGFFVKNAYVVSGNMGEPQIAFNLTDAGTKAFARVTTEYKPDSQTGKRHRLAVILDGKLYSAPVIEEPITGGSCQITGNFTDKEAQSLASVLNNPLPAAVSIVDTNSF